MTDQSPSQSQESTPSVKSGSASAWRAFFCVLIAAGFYNGIASMFLFNGSPTLLGLSSCALGAFVASFFAIKWRKLDRYWPIVFRLYIVYFVTALLVGLVNGVSTYSISAAIPGGLLTALLGTALFYWRNILTNIIFNVSWVGLILIVGPPLLTLLFK